MQVGILFFTVKKVRLAMEKFFKITNKKLFKEVSDYRKNAHERNEFAKRFFDENSIDGNEYYFGGTGMCNSEFQERNKGNISLAISATENNMAKFQSDFKKVKVCETLLGFKKTSKLLKKFQDECITNHVVINLLRVRIGDYFKELHLGGFGTEGLHEHDGVFYLKVHTDHYDTITPEYDGFEEIKGSEYHLVLESLQDAQ